MGLRFYLKPVTRLGVSHWLAFAVDASGRLVWQVTGMSEAGVRTAALKYQNQLHQQGV